MEGSEIHERRDVEGRKGVRNRRSVECWRGGREKEEEEEKRRGRGCGVRDVCEL